MTNYNEQNSATIVTINLKVSMCRDIIAISNITKAYVVNPCDSCNTDVKTPLIAIHVHAYNDYVIIIILNVRAEYIHCTYKSMRHMIPDYVMTQDSIMTSLYLPRMRKRLATSA